MGAYDRPSKLITAATAVRNKVAPAADRAVCLLPLTETAVGAVTNLGVRNSTSTWPLFSSAVHAGVPTFTGAGVEAPYTTFDGNTQYLNVHTNSSGSTIDLPRGTMILRFRNDAVASNQTLVWNGLGAPTDGRFYIVLAGAGRTLSISIRYGAATYTLSWASISTGWHTVVVSWGENGFWGYLDTLESLQSAALTGGWTIPNTYYLRLVKGSVANTVVTDVGFFAMIDRQLRVGEVLKYLADPWLLGRPSMNATTEFHSQCGPLLYDVSDTGVKMAVVAGSAPAVGTRYLRLCYGTSPLDLGSAVTMNVVNPTAYQKMALTVSGLSAGTRYYGRLEQNTVVPDATSVPFPCGLLTWMTEKAPGSTIYVAFQSDSHQGDMDVSPLDEGYGYGSDVGPDVTPYATWRADHDLAHVIEGALGAKIDYFIHGGDEEYIQSEISEPIGENPNPNMILRACRYRDYRSVSFAAGNVDRCLGNHDIAYGSDSAAAKYQTLDCRKRTMPQPAAESVAENYWSRTVGDALFCFVDCYTYHSAADKTQPWALGSTQWAWLENALATRTVKWAFIVIHQRLGGHNYGWGSDIFTSEVLHTEQARLLAICRKYGAVLLMGHQHIAAIYRYHGVLHIHSGPSVGPNATAGANFGTLENSAENFRHYGVVGRYGGFGYFILKIAPLTCRVYWRKYMTGCCALGSDFEERQLLGPYTVSGGKITLGERPIEVQLVVPKTDLDNNLDDAWWDDPDLLTYDVRSAPPGLYNDFMDYGSADVPVTCADGTVVYVVAAPALIDLGRLGYELPMTGSDPVGHSVVELPTLIQTNGGPALGHHIR